MLSERVCVVLLLLGLHVLLVDDIPPPERCSSCSCVFGVDGSDGDGKKKWEKSGGVLVFFY